MVRCRRESSHENSYRVVSLGWCCRGDVVIVSMRRPPRCLRLTMRSNSTSRSPVSLAAICRLGTTQPRQPVHTVVTLTRGNPHQYCSRVSASRSIDRYDAVLASYTTMARSGLAGYAVEREARSGIMSGMPLAERSGKGKERRRGDSTIKAFRRRRVGSHR